MLQIKLSPRVLFDYYAASSVEEAVSYLGAHQGEARVVSGGTELLPQVQRGELAAGHLVDVSQIAALRRVAVGADQVVIGGAAPLSTAQLCGSRSTRHSAAARDPTASPSSVNARRYQRPSQA